MNQPTDTVSTAASDPNTAFIPFTPSAAANPKDAANSIGTPPQDAAPEDGLRVVIADNSLLNHTGINSPIAQLSSSWSRD